MLADIVSRGGNLLLDIGPAGDGTIPVNHGRAPEPDRQLAGDQWRRHLWNYAVKNNQTMERGQDTVDKLQQRIQYSLRHRTVGIEAAARASSAGSSVYRQEQHTLRYPDELAGQHLFAERCARFPFRHAAWIFGAAEIYAIQSCRNDSSAGSPGQSASTTCLGTQTQLTTRSGTPEPRP